MVAGADIVRVEQVMGTVVSFHIFTGPCPVPDAEAALSHACQALHRLEAIFSTWSADSPMTLLREGRARLEEVPAEIPVVLELCAYAKKVSGGWFDPWAMPGGVDPTGLVKGWAIERAAEFLQSAGVGAAIVNGGGDIALFGRPPEGPRWGVGIRHPWRPDALACVMEVNSAIATSGCYERGPHLIDPHDGKRVSRSASATVVGPSLALADAMATALAVGGRAVLEALCCLEGYGGYWIGADGSEEATPDINFVDAGRSGRQVVQP